MENSIYLPLVSNDYHPGQSVSPTESDVMSSPEGVERLVANGMLIVIAQPGEFSSTFSPGDPVTTLVDTDVRLGPGTNYASLAVVLAGTHGNILEQMNGLDGVLAKSSYWWYVDLGGITGWVAEAALSRSVGAIKWAGP